MTQNKNHYVIIMAGGIGSRFWPVSKKSFPKQFIDILGTGESLIKQTFNRFTHLVPEENIFIVTNKDYAELVQEHIPQIKTSRIILEPSAKNTAPCIALANLHIKSINPEATILVAPSDHLILSEIKFIQTAKVAISFAESNPSLLTLGIKPTRPDTGYGYIQFNKTELQDGIYKVKTFTEKPTLDIAISFLESKEFLWNAGIFVWSLKSISNSIEQHLPEIHQLFAELDVNAPNYHVELEKSYAQCPSISIDYGIMEKDDFVCVLPSEFGWSDLGTWKSLWDVSDKDPYQNALIGKNTHAFDSKNSLVFNDTDKLVVISGVDNLVVVESQNVLLVINNEKEQEVKTVVGAIKDQYKGKYD